MKTILVTGSTDGIGLATATRLTSLGHHVILHGRDAERLERAEATVGEAAGGSGSVEGHLADLARPEQVEALAGAVAERHETLDALINNAGVLRVPGPARGELGDVRFAVNTIAPYLLTRSLLPLLAASGRVVNVSSAAQSPVDLRALAGEVELADMPAYAQSKLALTMWSRHLASTLDGDQVVVAVNPGSLLATKMVRDGFGVSGSDVAQGADILVRAALDDEFGGRSGEYFDNDAGRFAPPHPDALDPAKVDEVVRAIEAVLARRS
ncbi:SDR family NAD(P)-dependent oxidoreductase [Nocardioides donggukensis]|uniref:SDR family NAD(P)-dependent oxidoreductase n=1 Tax=Nocardioides donggukensis TaxID=2774019 RepID=A0A927Q052_9ACTN|nr:SDR family NAD(P)-dependent oxidoreductase [Nocardioides donggukensis]MBD8870195.1 SDR family NAD(P)-dependent oxidoreductase [Nocardioides donggukensis]